MSVTHPQVWQEPDGYYFDNGIELEGPFLTEREAEKEYDKMVDDYEDMLVAEARERGE